MKKEIYGATLERGKVTEKIDGKYLVASITRDGITSAPIKAIPEDMTLGIGDPVYFFCLTTETG